MTLLPFFSSFGDRLFTSNYDLLLPWIGVNLQKAEKSEKAEKAMEWRVHSGSNRNRRASSPPFPASGAPPSQRPLWVDNGSKWWTRRGGEVSASLRCPASSFTPGEASPLTVVIWVVIKSSPRGPWWPLQWLRCHSAKRRLPTMPRADPLHRPELHPPQPRRLPFSVLPFLSPRLAHFTFSACPLGGQILDQLFRMIASNRIPPFWWFLLAPRNNNNWTFFLFQ